MNQSVSESVKYRILISDDEPAIHEDFAFVLGDQNCSLNQKLQSLSRELFSSKNLELQLPIYQIDHAYQGNEAVNLVQQANQEGNPYALIFMDSRMPPGMDGVQTIKKIWNKCPETEIALITAYSDYSWIEIVKILGCTDQLVFLRKPFDDVTIRQLALALTKKWELKRAQSRNLTQLQKKLTIKSAKLKQTEQQIKNNTCSASEIELGRSPKNDLNLSQIQEPIDDISSTGKAILNNLEQNRYGNVPLKSDLSKIVKEARQISDILDELRR